MLFIVDGTGPFFDADYGREMRYSFCRQLQNQLAPSNAMYFRGPI